MQPRLATHLGGLILAAIGLLLFPALGRTETFIYDDFRSPDDLILKGDAAPLQERMRLTPAAQGKVGGMWYKTKVNVKDGFETTFRFQITESTGADGLAFVIQNNDTPQLGDGGSGIGFWGVTNAFIIKFDNYHSWLNEVMPGIYDEIAVQAGKEVQFSSNTNFIASATKGITFSDGQVHTAKIVYAPGNLQVFLDDLENPVMTVYLNVAKLIPLDDGQAWVGFSAATGAAYQNQDLLSWSFASSANPLTSQISNPSVTSSPLENAVFSGATAPSIATPLPPDPSFGYVLPAGVGLTHIVEASADLVNWTTVTNASLYFRDPESTNYVQRFYRFREK